MNPGASAERLGPREYHIIAAVVTLGVVMVLHWSLAVVFLRGNRLAYIASAALAAARSSCSLLAQGNTSLAVQGAIPWAVLLGWLVFSVVRSSRPRAVKEG